MTDNGYQRGDDTFAGYASFYDSLYADKDYEAECDFVVEVLDSQEIGRGASILDLGCGTGGHAIPLARRGYEVAGVDRSGMMVERARAKVADETLPVEFLVGDVRDAVLDRRFDAVISMFAVVSYQLTDEDLLATLATARRHLAQGGVFLFDVWFGPAVLAERPEVRTKRVELPDGGSITRVAQPAHDEAANTVTVSYEVTRADSAGATLEHTRESHTVRYLFTEELERLLVASGFELVALGPFGDLSREPTKADWNVSAVARAV